MQSTLDRVRAYIKANESKDPMLVPCNTTYDPKPKGGGGCTLL